MSPELARELRAARPVASPELRSRVLAVAAEPVPQPRRRVAWPSRRFVLAAVPAALAIALGFAAAHGIVHGAKRNAVQGRSSTFELLNPTHGAVRAVSPASVGSAAAPNATSGRLQQYGATLSVQVGNREDLSNATKRAMRFARILGGYVASVRYSAPRSGRGSAEIVVRVPVDRVQDAIQEYSGLGTLLDQRVAIADVTKAVEEEAKEIARIRAEIAAIEQGGVSSDERPKLAALQARLDYLTKRRAATVRRAELARISLGLVEKPQAAATTSRFRRTLNDAGGVLVRELELLVYALIVVGPLLLLGGAVIAAGRMRDRRLFERS